MEENLKLFDKEVEKASKRKSIAFRFCPICGSTNLKPVIYGMGKDAVALSPQMRCVDCKFYGFVFEGTPEYIKEFKDNLKNKKETE